MVPTEQYEDDDMMAALTNLSKEETGLPVVVWIAVRRPAECQPSGVLFNNSASDTLLPESLIAISVDRDSPRILADDAELKIPQKDFHDLLHWIKHNYERLMAVWNGEITPMQFCAAQCTCSKVGRMRQQA